MSNIASRRFSVSLLILRFELELLDEDPVPIKHTSNQNHTYRTMQCMISFWNHSMFLRIDLHRKNILYVLDYIHD